MTYGQKLKQCIDNASEKFKKLDEIRENFRNLEYSDRDLQRAENEHRAATNEFNKIYQEMKDKGLDLNDEYIE